MTAGRTRPDRAVAALGLLALAAAVTTVARAELDLFRLRGWGVVVTVALGVLAVLAGRLGRRLLGLAAGLGFLAAAAVQTVQLGGEAGAVRHGLLGGNASTFALWLGLGAGLPAAGAAGDPEGSAAAPADSVFDRPEEDGS